MEFSLSIHPLMDTFHVLAIVNGLAVNILECRHVFETLVPVPLDNMPRCKIWVSTVVLFSISSAARMPFPTVASLTSFPSVVCESSLFSRFSPTLVIFCHFDADRPDRSEVVPHCGFSLHFLDDE